MHILPLLNLNFNKYKNNNKSVVTPPVSFSGTHYRVDKGMERFFDFNKDRMPMTLLKYLNGVEDKKQLTPLQAQRNAFGILMLADTVDEIKSVFPDEELFENLKPVEKTTSVNGILALIKKLNPVMKELDIAPLKSKEDFAVYLVKKVFIETKDLKEINKDLENDLDELFKSEYRAKYPKSPFVSKDTFNAIGLKLPDHNYMHSLKFTREGYSDSFGEVVSLANKIYWDSLTQEQRDALAKKSTEKLENWWNSLSQEKKLEMIAQDENTLKMLEEYNDFKKQNVQPSEKKEIVEKTPVENTGLIKVQHTKTGSETLSKDELFKRWASNKLAVFEEGLSEQEKIQLSIKRARNASARWEQMTPAEKSDYLSKLKSGAEPMRYTMIDAWNNSFELLKDLSDFMTEKQVENPIKSIFSKETFSEFMSRIMTEFWAMHTEEAKQFGLEISKAWKRVDDAIQNGTYEQLRAEIIQKRNIRFFDLQKYKSQKTETQSPKVVEPKSDEPKVEPAKKQDVKATTKKPNVEKIETEQKSSSKIKKGEIGYLLLVEFVNQVATEGRKFTNIPESMTPPEMNAEGIDIADEIPEEHKQDYENIQTMRTMPLIYVLNKYFSKRAIGGISTDYAKSIMEILPQIKNDTKKITYGDGENVQTIRLKPGVGDGSKYIDLYKELTKPLSKQDVSQIMKKYFPEEINGEPVEMTQENREKLQNYIEKFGTKYLTRIFTEKSIEKYELNDLYYKGFKSAVSNKNPDKIQGLLDTKEYKYVIKSKKQLINQMQNNYPYLPAEFLETYLSIGLSSIANGKDMFEEFKKCYITPNKNDKSAIFHVPLNNATVEEKVKLLAVQKAIADVIYEETEDESIFNKSFEDLLVYAEEASAVMRKKPNLNKIQTKYNEYLTDCKDWLENIQTDETLSPKEKTDELIYILNPNENWKSLDEIIEKNIQKYHIEQEIV